MGAIFIGGCRVFKAGGLPDWQGSFVDNYRDTKPIGGSAGADFTDKSGRAHKVRVFAAMTSPELGDDSRLHFRQDTVFFFGFWWSFDF